MSPDKAAGTASLLLLLVLGFMGMFAGIGIILGSFTHGGKAGEGGGGSNLGKVVAFFVIGLVAAAWLSAPGTGHGIAALINAMWANLVIGLQPLVAIVTQLAMLAAIGIVGFYAVRHFFRRR